MALFHAHLLFTEGTEEILHQSPFQESTILVDPCHFQPSELAYFGNRVLGGGNGAFLLIQIDEHLDFVADVHVFGHITLREKDLAFFTAVKVKSEID